MMDLSIVVPSIRVENWLELIESIKSSCGDVEFEVIFVGPKYNPVVDSYTNVKYVRDFGSPNRCQQIGLSLAEAEYVTWGSDDCMYTEGSISECLRVLKEAETESDKPVAITINYDENDSVAVSDFLLTSCYGNFPHIENNWFIFNAAIMKREELEEIGGFDCSFDVTCLGHSDLAARWQHSGYKVVAHNIKLMKCSWMPGTSGDHAPIHYSQTIKDMPMYGQKYSQGAFPSDRIDFDNWKLQPSVWDRRFLENKLK